MDLAFGGNYVYLDCCHCFFAAAGCSYVTFPFAASGRSYVTCLFATSGRYCVIFPFAASGRSYWKFFAFSTASSIVPTI